MIQVFGIKNCDTVKKALKWLNANKVSYEFRDFKKEELTPKLVSVWIREIDPSLLINRRGTTWRKLSEEQKSQNDEADVIQLIIDNPSLLKRPLVDNHGDLFVGFNADEWQQKFL